MTQPTDSVPFDLGLELPLPLRKDVPIGCIGAGFIMDECHLTAYRQAGLSPVAIASRRPERAAEVAARHEIPKRYDSYRELLDDPELEVIDVAVPPDVQGEVIEQIVRHGRNIKGILAQKPLGVNYRQAKAIVAMCEQADIVLAANQNMRYDQSVRACRKLIEQNVLGEPVLATINMRAVPHWMPWQERQGWVTLRIMSIHHLDTFRYWFGEPTRVSASVRPDPRTSRRFAHQDGICTYTLEFANDLRACAWDDVYAGPDLPVLKDAVGIEWRVEGTAGLALGTIGWPKYPERSPSTIDFACEQHPEQWFRPRWDAVWFPDAFAGPMTELLLALEENRLPSNNGRDNLRTMALVDACYMSAREHRAISLQGMWA